MNVVLAMTYNEFVRSLSKNHPPENSPYLKSLWYEKKGNWDKAHQIAQEIPDCEGSWIHAYLHRVEGDIWNSNYWYDRAGRKMPDISLEKEWEHLVRYFIKQASEKV
jgi:hypothetical protein